MSQWDQEFPAGVFVTLHRSNPGHGSGLTIGLLFVVLCTCFDAAPVVVFFAGCIFAVPNAP